MADHTIFLQLSDGTVEAIPCAPGATEKEVVLERAPRVPLSLDPRNYATTTFQIVRNDSQDARMAAFLVTEKEPGGDLTSVIRAVNYNERYYANDHDFVAEDGPTPTTDPLSADYLWAAGGYASSDEAAAVLQALENLVTVDLPARDLTP